MDYIIITGANDLYIKTIIDFIQCNHCDMTKLILYDLGFNEVNLKKIVELQNNYNFMLKKFNFSEYPEHVYLNKYNGLYCSYAFKPIILYNEANEEYSKNKIIIWMDSANRFSLNNIHKIMEITNKQGIYSPISAERNTINSFELNNYRTVDYYNISEFEHKYLLESISANLVSLKYSSPAGSYIIDNWYKDSLNSNIIVPENTNRNNHRQDQTVLSILMYIYEQKHHITFNKEETGVQFFIKKDESTIQSDLTRFKICDKNGKFIYCMPISCKTLDEAICVYADRKKLSIEEFLKHFTVVHE